MSSEKTKWWKTPPYSNIVGGLTVALILWLVKLGYDWCTVTPILSTVSDRFRYIWDSLMSFANIPIPLWAVLGTFFWYSIIYWLYHKKGKTNKVEKTIPEEIVHTGKKAYPPVALDIDYVPMDVLEKMSKDIERDNDELKLRINNMLDYTADKFNLVIWRWKWVYNTLIKRHEPKEISPACQEVLCEQSPMEFSNRISLTKAWYTCLKCGQNRPIEVRSGEIEMLIDKRANEILTNDLAKAN